ncbi:MAG TPA: zf-HC2 domain-containing protein, partial [Blastocatellia bacterium]|nr:zf-HC2 domain-containing protein [Blastocatellia bacterium]
MRLSSEELKRLYQHETARSTRPGADCPGAELLLQLAEGELSREERERVADHLVACSDCAHEYRIISSACPSQERAASAARASGAGVSFFSAPLARALAVAAMVLIAIGASIIVWQMGRGGAGPGEVVRGGRPLLESVVPEDRSVLGEAPAHLSWTAAEAADSYQVVLYDYQSTPIWESEPAAATSITIPEAVRQRLGRGKPIYWRVITQRGLDR